MPLAFDDDGSPVTPEDLSASPNVAVVKSAQRAGKKLANAPASLAGWLKQNAPPMAAQMGGEAGGAALGGLLAPETGGLSMAIPLLMGAAGAGAANVAAMKNLPKEYGGDPESSTTSDFMWGAGPAAVGRMIPSAIGKSLGKKMAKGVEATTEGFEKEAAATGEQYRKTIEEGMRGPAVTQADVERVGKSLGSPTGYAGLAPEGEERTQLADIATDAALGPINRMRRKLGEPIGKAYESLKGDAAPISPQSAQDLADAASNISDSLLSPAPKAKAVLNKVKRYAPPPNGDPAALMEQAAHNMPWKNGDLLPDGRRVVTVQPDGKLIVGGNEGFDEIDPPQASPAATKYTPPTLDELRELRQGVNASLRTAQGGNAHALLGLQQALDTHLMEHLPDDMGAMRKSYRGFIQNYPWRAINKVREIGSPEGVSKWMFDREPSVVNEGIRNATPAEKETYKSMFGNHVLQGVTLEADPEANAKLIRHNLEKYRQNGTLQALYGKDATQMYSNFIHLPARRAIQADSLASTAGKQTYAKGFMNAAKTSGKADLQAAQAGFDAWYGALPPESQAIVRQSVQPLEEMPHPAQLPAPRDVLAQQLKPKEGGKFYAPRFVIASGLGNVALGATASHYTAAYAIGFGLMMAGNAGSKALMRHGGADLIAKLYASPTGRAAGAAAFRALVTLGGRVLHNAKPQDDDNQP